MSDETTKPAEDEPTEFGLPSGEIPGAETPAGEDEDAAPEGATTEGEDA